MEKNFIYVLKFFVNFYYGALSRFMILDTRNSCDSHNEDDEYFDKIQADKSPERDGEGNVGENERVQI